MCAPVTSSPPHALPLVSYDAAEYRLEIVVTDRLTGARVDDRIPFTIRP